MDFSFIGTDVWQRIWHYCRPFERIILSSTSSHFKLSNRRPIRTSSIAIRSRKAYAVQWCISQGYKILPAWYRQLAKCGSVELIKYAIQELNFFPEEYTSIFAIESRSLTLVQWLVENGYPISDHATNYAVTLPDLNIFHYLVSKGFAVKDTVTTFVCSVSLDNKIQRLEYLINTYNIQLHSTCINEAARCKDICVIKYLMDKGIPLTRRVFKVAITTGDKQLIEWLIEHKCPTDGNNNILTPAYKGNIEFIKYLYSQGIPFDTKSVFSSAVQSGNIELLEYLKSINIKPKAALALNIETAQWLYKNGILPTPTQYTVALCNGDIPLSSWMESVGVTTKVITMAIIKNNIDVLRTCTIEHENDYHTPRSKEASEWLFEQTNQRPCSSLLGLAVYELNDEWYTWLWDRGCRPDCNAMSYFIRARRYDLVDMYIDVFEPYHVDIFAETGDLPGVKRYISKVNEGNIQSFVKAGRYAILEWIFQQKPELRIDII